MKRIIIEYFLFSIIYSFIKKKQRRFLMRTDCLLLGSECQASKDMCCRDEYLKCKTGIKRSGALNSFDICEPCFNQECENDSDCCEGALVCKHKKCSFPIGLKCKSDYSTAAVEKNPDHCFNSFFGCYEGECKPCGGRECKSGEDCCSTKGYFCDKGLGICQRKNNCMKEKYTCATNEDCCIPLGCKNSICLFCMKVDESCSSADDCCSGLTCNAGLCRMLKKNGKDCLLDDECQSRKCVMKKCGDCSVSTKGCLESRDCCAGLICVQRPGSEERICADQKVCSSLSEDCSVLKCCIGKCSNGRCRSCISGPCTPGLDICCGEERCLPSLEKEGEFLCSVEKLCAAKSEFCNPPTLQCCHGECKQNKCQNCVAEKEICGKDSDCCEGFICRLDNEAERKQKVCMAKRQCAEDVDECGDFLKCCEGVCVKGKCQNCLTINRQCDMGSYKCCPGLICVVDKLNQERKVCYPEEQCKENWRSCKKDEECCSELCYQNKCTVCHEKNEICDYSPCCKGLQCVEDPSGTGRQICSEKKLCANLEEGCSNEFECCQFQGFCFKGKCKECLKLNSICTLDGVKCCNDFVCATNPIRPEEKLCATQKLCKDDGDECSESDELACCNALCFKGKCSKCKIPQEECSPSGIPCCGEYHCVVNPEDPSKGICETHAQCAVMNTRCNEKMKCCRGECIRGICKACGKRREVCDDGDVCCEPMQCFEIQDRYSPGKKICEFKKICLELDQECSETSLPCCRGDCLNNKCQFCHTPFQNCTLSQECCRGMRCDYEPTGNFKVCQYDPSCIAYLGNCSVAKCCPQFKCFNDVCLDCELEGDPCSGNCCPGLNCLMSEDGKGKFCTKKNETCVVIGGRCTHPQASCCPGLVCHKGKCRKCHPYATNCTKAQDCCQGLKCSWDDKGIGKLCLPTVNCIKDYGKCDQDQICCKFLNCWKGKCLKCAISKEACEVDSQCCEGLTCEFHKLGERKYCWTEKLCVEEMGYCGHRGSQCCNGTQCIEKRCRNCTAHFQHCNTSKDCCDDMVCKLDESGEKRICIKNSAICVEESGSCREPDSKCCKGNYCSEEKICRRCRAEEEDCKTSHQCCSGLFCTINKRGNGYKCDDEFGCVEEFGYCGPDKRCCKGLNCWKGRCSDCEGCTECKKESVVCHMYKPEELKEIEEKLRLAELEFDKGLNEKAKENALEPNTTKLDTENIIKGDINMEAVKEALDSRSQMENQKELLKNVEKVINNSLAYKAMNKTSEVKKEMTLEEKLKKMREMKEELKKKKEETKKPNNSTRFARVRKGKRIKGKLPFASKEKKGNPIQVLLSKTKREDILSKLKKHLEAKASESQYTLRDGDLYSDFRFSQKATRRCCYGLICTWDPSGSYTYCDEQEGCIDTFGTCSGYNAKCCKGLNCFEGICKPCSLYQEDCNELPCCGKNVCTFSDDGKIRHCQAQENCIKSDGNCTHWDAKCCSGLLCFNGKCQSCSVDGDICEFSLCCLSFNCLLDVTGLVKTCTKLLDRCQQSGGSCKRLGSKCCNHLYCDRDKICQKCSGEAEDCQLDPHSCCQGLFCSIDKTGDKMHCSKKKNCVALDGSCKLVPEGCCDGLICNHRHVCVPPILEENQLCRFDKENRTTNESSPVFLDSEAAAPFEPCKEGFGCFLENTGTRRICQKEEPCIVNEGSCLHPDSNCCEGTWCNPQRNNCEICRTENSTCSEEKKCCPNFKCVLDSMGHTKICSKAPICIEKHGDCTNPAARCCSGLSCLGPTDEDSVKIKESPDLDSMKRVELYKYEKDFMNDEMNKEPVSFIQVSGKAKKSCLNCLPFGHQCDDSEKSAGYKCCAGLFCTTNDDGMFKKCQERRNCVKEHGLCQLEGVSCCMGFKCNKKGRCHREGLQGDHCTDEDADMCADGFKCLYDSTGRSKVCSTERICIERDGDCTHSESKCCTGFFCKEGICNEVAKCLKVNITCELEDKPLPCCDGLKCNLDSKGLIRTCTERELCVELGGACHEVDAKCCSGLSCDERRRCSCSDQGEPCEHGQKCCEGKTCQWDLWGEKKICSQPETCVIEGGRCDHHGSHCCEELVCTGPKRPQNTMIPMPVINRCIRPTKCIDKTWQECDEVERPCCLGLICAKDVFETGNYCQEKPKAGVQCYSEKFCQFGSPELDCIQNICTQKEHKCAILTEECSETECCPGYVCADWAERKRCKKEKGYKCEHSDDCEKHCDPIYGKCSDEELEIEKYMFN